jgi:NADPH:quinone reductase-like Zn-dependent oxidoreductase
MGTAEDLEWGLARVRDGEIRPVLDRVIPLRDASAAHRMLVASEVTGNLVLDPWA